MGQCPLVGTIAGKRRCHDVGALADSARQSHRGRIAEDNHLRSLAKREQGATPRGNDVTADHPGECFIGDDRDLGAKTLT
jgi:hypothetical protein